MRYFIRETGQPERSEQEISIFSQDAITEFDVEVEDGERLIEVKFGDIYIVKEEKRTVEKLFKPNKKKSK